MILYELREVICNANKNAEHKIILQQAIYNELKKNPLEILNDASNDEKPLERIAAQLIMTNKAVFGDRPISWWFNEYPAVMHDEHGTIC